VVSAAAVAIAVVGVSLGAWLLLRDQLGSVVDERLNRQVGFAIKMDSAGMRTPAPESGPDTPLLQTVFPDGSWLTPPGQAAIPVSATEREVARRERYDTTEDVKINSTAYRVLTRWIHTKQTGANGRAIQIGTELLVTMRRKPKVAASGEPVTSQTYSITPSTLDRIEQLLPCYEKRGTVLRAVVQVLQEYL